MGAGASLEGTDVEKLAQIEALAREGKTLVRKGSSKQRGAIRALLEGAAELPLKMLDETMLRSSGEAAHAMAVCRSYDRLATALTKEGRKTEALGARQRCLRLAETTVGVSRSDLAVYLNNMALLLSSLGRFEEALACHRKALRIKTKQHGPDSVDVATTLNNMGLVLRRLGMDQEAKRVYVRAIAIKKRKFGPRHPALATLTANLAVLLRDSGDYAAAERLFRFTVAVRAKHLGPDHLAVAKTLDDYADTLDLQGDRRRASLVAHEASAIRDAADADILPGLSPRGGATRSHRVALRRSNNTTKW